MTDIDTVKALIKAMDRLVRFNRALITMGAIETPKALEVELAIAWECKNWAERELDRSK